LENPPETIPPKPFVYAGCAFPSRQAVQIVTGRFMIEVRSLQCFSERENAPERMRRTILLFYWNGQENAN
jgi:hypothetical protein